MRSMHISRHVAPACCAFVAAALSAGCSGKPSPGEASEPSDGPAEASAVANRKSAGPDPQRLVGEWVRPDGGYVIKIARVASDGVVDASYHNPSPINVERARATTEGGKLKLHLKLNDRGYPGCVYELEYDRENDVMVGTYFQAAMRQTYRIGFQRTR